MLTPRPKYFPFCMQRHDMQVENALINSVFKGKETAGLLVTVTAIPSRYLAI